MKIQIAFGFTLLLVACAQDEGNTSLGIARFEVSETGNSLRITGIDAKQKLVGELTLQVTATGRVMAVEVLGQKANLDSNGHDHLYLPPLLHPELNQFVHDAHVRPVLDRWGIGLFDRLPNGMEPAPVSTAPTQPADERAYGTCTYSSIAACNRTSCCQEPYGDEQSQLVCCATFANGGSQTYGFRVCTAPNQYTYCGTGGNNGCAGCWAEIYNDNPYLPCQAFYNGGSCQVSADPRESTSPSNMD